MSDTRTITIYTSLLDALTTRIDRANRRANRLGLDGYTLTTSTTDPEPIYDEDRISRWERDSNGVALYPLDSNGAPLKPDYYRARTIATIDGIVPTLPGGWTIIGLVEEDSIIGPMPKLVSDEARALNLNLDIYRDLDTWDSCDHCHTNRRRARVYLLRDDAGQIVRVGSTCLAPFLGIQIVIPDDFIGSLDADLDELECFTGISGVSDDSYLIDDILALAYSTVQRYGWCSSSNAKYSGATSTAERVRLALKSGLANALLRDELISGAPRETVAEIREFAANLRDVDDSEYARTLSAIVRGHDADHNLISGSNLGFLVSAISGWQRSKQQAAEQAAAVNSVHVGTVKKRETFKGLTVIFTRQVDSMYGTKTLIKFADQNGNILVWWCTSVAVPEHGKTYDVLATVKDHDEYNGVAQTQINRCKCVEVPAADSSTD